MNKLNCIVKRLAAFALALVLLASPLGIDAEPAPVRGSAVGMDLTGFTSVTFGGEPVDGSIFSDATVTVINLWQRWCGPCMIELPHFLALHEYYSATPAADVQVWGALYYEHSYEVQDAVNYVNENGYFWNHMLICDELLDAANAGSPEGLTSIPQTLIVDRSGIVRAQVVGKVDSEAELFELVSEWLEILSAEEGFVPGDLDGSGSVNAADAILAMRHAMGLITLTAEQIEIGDVEGNGSIGVSDAVAILRLAMEL
ncbi:MAG: redoxin domain-containing protein [Clostridia bacterium]|nr:redoxin domain-containing protein [Clostridia bacterium]